LGEGPGEREKPQQIQNTVVPIFNHPLTPSLFKEGELRNSFPPSFLRRGWGWLNKKEQ
jgi:hypothetical protein